MAGCKKVKQPLTQLWVIKQLFVKVTSYFLQVDLRKKLVSSTHLYPADKGYFCIGIIFNLSIISYEKHYYFNRYCSFSNFLLPFGNHAAGC